MNGGMQQSLEQVEGSPPGPSNQPAPTQYQSPFPVSIAFPSSVEIKMVDASTLSDYEILIFAAAVLSNAFIGFGVAWYQVENHSFVYGATTVIFGLLFVATVAWAFRKRYKMVGSSKSFNLTTSNIEETSK